MRVNFFSSRVRSRQARRNRLPEFETLEVRKLLSDLTISYGAPIVITRGGTYTGNWESNDPKIAAVTISTDQPVTIANSHIRGKSTLILTNSDHVKLTVRDTYGYGLNPDVYGQTPGLFLDAEEIDRLDVEHNYMEGTSGMFLLHYRGNGTTADTIKVLDNKALNIDGRKSDGRGGFLDFNTRTRISDGFTEDGFELAHFLLLNNVWNVPGAEVAWNQVINEPGKSRVEENINIYLSSGTASSPLKIHDNYIRGAYTVKPGQGDYSDGTYNYDWSYTGGGILLADGRPSDGPVPAYVRAYNNEVVSTTNQGIAIEAGHDNQFYNNRIVSSGLLPDGTRIAAQNVGALIWDAVGSGSRFFHNNSGHNNKVGWVNPGNGRRNDWWVPNASSWTNNVSWPGQITRNTETAEFAFWNNKLKTAKVVVGPQRRPAAGRWSMPRRVPPSGGSRAPAGSPIRTGVAGTPPGMTD
jgi:hypothetical protein